MIRLLALLMFPLLAAAQINTPAEYKQICPTPDCEVRDAIQSITQTSGAPHETTFSGYIRGVHPQSNAVALFGLATREGPGASWGINTLMQDSETRAAHGERGRLLIGWEADFNVTGPSDIIGVSVGGNSIARANSANAYIANTLGPQTPWDTAFWSMDGVAYNALAIGSMFGNPNVSQRIMFRSGPYLQLLQAENGTLRLYSTGANALHVEGGSVIADRFQPTAPQTLSDTATTRQIVQRLRALGLVL